ncbi:MAG: fibrillarin [Candidatus Terraquivivens tikiterensis]|uniref:Fibrillarin-like rRNA/tRNA 2'-O-methyltransferase n=1 Tax=Candidatus Terraquivivens tikiterensis TaxID=1980982 RepID=A0A2R7Y1P9_9ARCH|nr:MAG: fibrillarin [Candidatus Terraquivivens tikiterensis]
MMLSVEKHERFEGVYWVYSGDERLLATRNLDRGFRVYGERLFRIDGEEYREWIPYRSKLAAAILSGIKDIGIRPGCRVLYLGIASGTTASHVSDIIGENGMLYGVDFAPMALAQFKRNVADRRRNAVAIYADARLPMSYKPLVGQADLIYCDIAQPEQAKILVENARLMLKDEGLAMIAIKARSIDSVEEPSKVYKQEVSVLESNDFVVLDKVDLGKYEQDHIMVLARYSPKKQKGR